MKRTLKAISFVMLSCLLLCGNAFAWSIDITPAYGDQDATDILAEVNDTVYYQIWFNADSGGNVFNGGSGATFRFLMDVNEIEFDLANSSLETVGMLYTAGGGGLKEDPEDYVTWGYINMFGDHTFTGSTLLGTLAFTVLNPIDDDEYDLVYDDTVIPTQDGWTIDGQFWTAEQIVADHHLTDGADIAPAAVPVPAAAWLLGSGLLGLVGLRRRNK